MTSEAAEQLLIESRVQWRRWLGKHHARTDGLWLVTWKKTSGGPHVSYDEVVEEALAHGWIDSKSRALDAVEQLTVPPDLAAALGRQPAAAAHFDAFPRSVKRGILEWIVQAKRPETRAKRIDETARLAQRNERANQWSRRT